MLHINSLSIGSLTHQEQLALTNAILRAANSRLEVAFEHLKYSLGHTGWSITRGGHHIAVGITEPVYHQLAEIVDLADPGLHRADVTEG